MRKKILCLALTVVLAAGSAVSAYAKDYVGADGWKVEFNGSEMTENFTNEDLQDQMKDIQPGDSIQLKVQISNTDSGETDWYMTNEVLETLEEAKSTAEGGSYEYRLTYVDDKNAETVIYDSSSVGGEDTTGGEGLKQVDISSDGYFYLDRLSQGDTGMVYLTVGVEGETQGNGYQLTLAKLQLNFAVEKVKAGSTITKHITEQRNVYETRRVKTGDTNQALLYCVIALAGGVVLLVAGTRSLKRRSEENRRKGE